MPNIYKLSLKQRSGLLTELQSDTVFGHLCWRMKEISGEDILEDTLKEFLKLNQLSPVFTISDNLFEKNGKVYFPKPVFSKITKEDKILSKAEKLKQMCVYKERKSKKYIDTETLNLYLEGKIDEYEKSLDLNDSLKTFEDYLRTNVQISRETLSAAESKLFNYAPKYLNTKLSKKDDRVDICFLIKVIDDDNFNKFNCKELLKEVFNIGFGKKKSSGFGEFEVIEFDEYKELRESEDSDCFLNLSNYLPSENDKISNSYYEYHVKYGKLGEELSQSENPFKKPIIFFKPGSVFFTNENKPFYGRCTTPEEKISSFKEAIQNGYSFSLRARHK